LCVGLAYFLIAVLVPAALIALWQEPGGFKPVGTLWSLAAAPPARSARWESSWPSTPRQADLRHAAGVRPGAVINTFASILSDGSRGQIGPLFYAGLLLVVAGAVTVLIFAPRPSAGGQSACAAGQGTGKGLASFAAYV